MATHTKTVSLTDLQQNILKNDSYSDTDNAGLDKWIQDAVVTSISLPGTLQAANGFRCACPPRRRLSGVVRNGQ